jgi:hypothetical protein
MVLACISVAGDKSRPQAEKLLTDAEKLTDIRLPGSTPFRLKAHFLGNMDKGQTYEATYLLEWNSPTSWRDEFKATDFEEVRVAHGDRLLISRHPSTPVAELFRLHELIDFPVYFELAPSLKVEKLSERQTQGTQQRVVDVSVRGRPWTKVYLDSSQPLVNRIEMKGALSGPQYPFNDFESTWEFEDYREFHEHQFPRKLSFRNSSSLEARIEVLELVDADSHAAEFDPPADAHWIHWCPHPQPPKYTRTEDRLPLLPPPQFRAGGPAVHAQIYGIIATDGLWHNLTVLKSGGESVDSYFLKQLTAEKFTPAHCGDTPVEFENVLGLGYRP